MLEFEQLVMNRRVDNYNSACNDLLPMLRSSSRAAHSDDRRQRHSLSWIFVRFFETILLDLSHPNIHSGDQDPKAPVILL